MSVTRSVSEDGEEVTICIDGRFDFNVHGAFCQAYADFPAGARYVVDLSATEYMDSSALGMLLLLREHAGGERSNIQIQGCSDDIRRILTIANFNRLFVFG